MSSTSFPILNMPKIFCDSVIEMHRRTGIDPAAIATVLLVSFSLAASTKVRIWIESGFEIPPALFALIIAESGFGKSILYHYAVESFRNYEKESKIWEAENNQKFKCEFAIWDKKKKSLFSMLDKAFKNDEHEHALKLEQDIKQHEENKPIAIEADRLILNDSTPGAIKEFCAGTGKVVGMFLSEGSVAFKDGRMFSELGLLCDLYDGTSFTVDRKIGRSSSIIDPAASSLVFAQDQRFHKFCSKHGDDMLGNGVFQRTLIYLADQNRFFDSYLHYFHDKRYLEDFQNLIRTMLTEHGKLIKHHDRTKQILKLSPNALQFYQDKKQQLKYETQPMGTLEHFKGFAAKYTNNMIRIACLFHLMQGREGDIKRDSVVQANDFCHWYLQQAMLYFDENRKLEVKAHELYNWLNDELIKRGVSYLEKTKLYQFTPSRLRGRGKADIQPLLDILISKQMLMTERLYGVGTVVKRFDIGF